MLYTTPAREFMHWYYFNQKIKLYNSRLRAVPPFPSCDRVPSAEAQAAWRTGCEVRRVRGEEKEGLQTTHKSLIYCPLSTSRHC